MCRTQSTFDIPVQYNKNVIKTPLMQLLCMWVNVSSWCCWCARMDDDSCVLDFIEIVPCDNSRNCSESPDVKLSPSCVKVCVCVQGYTTWLQLSFVRFFSVIGTGRKWTHSSTFFCIFLEILSLQVEACDDYGENGSSDVSDKSRDVVNDSVMPAVRQVNSFISDEFVTLDTFSLFNNGSVYEVR